MLPSASVLAYRREERVQKAFSGDHYGHGDARVRVRATPSQGRKMRLCVTLTLQAWFTLDAPRFRALLPAPWADLALVSGSVHIF